MRAPVALAALLAVSCSGSDPASAGVTRVEAGPGLSGGPITASGALRIAPAGVDGTMLAPGSVGTDHLGFDVATQAELDGHDHDGRYAALGHLHDDRYAAAAHAHLAADVTDLAGAAVSAMGAKGAANPLHHDRYSDAEAVAAVKAAKVDGTMIAPGAVSVSQLAFDAATQAELDAALVGVLPLTGGAVSGDVAVGGALSVGGATTLGGDLDLGGHALRNARVAPTTSACDAAAAGALRWDAAGKRLQLCDGTGWSALLAQAQPFGAGASFCVGGGYVYTRRQAAIACQGLGMRLCTVAELSAHAEAGAETCCQGWTADPDPALPGYRTRGLVAFFMGSSERTDPVAVGCGGPQGGVSLFPQPATYVAAAHCCR